MIHLPPHFTLQKHFSHDPNSYYCSSINYNIVISTKLWEKDTNNNFFIFDLINIPRPNHYVDINPLQNNKLKYPILIN